MTPPSESRLEQLYEVRAWADRLLSVSSDEAIGWLVHLAVRELNSATASIVHEDVASRPNCRAIDVALTVATARLAEVERVDPRRSPGALFLSRHPQTAA